MGPSPLGPGSHVDHFKVIRRIGRGGMGEVFLARDTRLGRRVALKLIHPDRLGSPDMVARFVFEARTTARFNHPNIVTVYDIGEYQKLPYLALEYLEGQNLRSRLQEEGIAPREAARFCVAVASALAEAHRHGVLHRDLKPSNVFIRRDGLLRVLDFGLAKLISPDALQQVAARSERLAPPVAEEESFSSSGRAFRGTPAYMAPERWLLGECTPAADVWAMGMLLLEMLEGRHPWYEMSALEISVAACSSTVEMPGPTVEVHPELAWVVARCLDRRPASRPDATTVAERLSGFLNERGIQVGREPSPFCGLLAWDEHWADRFFGRDAEIDALVEKLRREPIIAVAGPSGVGKSSFVQAGVVPRLREQGLWLVLGLRPGREPLRAIAARLLWGEGVWSSGDEGGCRNRTTVAEGLWRERSRLSRKQAAEAEDQIIDELAQAPARMALRLAELAERAGSKVLLLIDQLEELFTLCSSDEARRSFLDAVLSSADDPLGPVRTVLVVREDFLGRLASAGSHHSPLREVLVLGVPSPEALREIAMRSVTESGYEFDDPGLVDDLVATIGEEPAALPLLQLTGELLWQRRDRDTRLLRRAAYDEAGGVAGAAARHAEEVLSTLSEQQVAITRELFLRLVCLDGTRRVVSRDALLEDLDGDAEMLVDRLVKERMMVLHRSRRTGETEVELVHEALVKVWSRLAHWIDDSRGDLELLGEVGQAAEMWQRRGRRSEGLWRGDSLLDALRSVRRCRRPIPARVSEFLSASQEHEQRHRRRRRRLVLAGVAALVVLAVVLSGLTLMARRQQRLAQQRLQLAEEKRAEALREGARADLGRGATFEARARLRTALEIDDSAEARALWWQLRQDPLCWTTTFGIHASILSFSPDGRSLAVSGGQELVLYDLKTRSARRFAPLQQACTRMSFTADGERLICSCRQGRIRAERLPSGETWNRVLPSAASPCVAAVAGTGLVAMAVRDRTILLVDSAGEEEPRSLTGHSGAIVDIRLSRDGRRLASAADDGIAHLWDVAKGTQLATMTLFEQETAVSTMCADGSMWAAVDVGGFVHVFDTKTGAQLAVLDTLDDETVLQLAFDETGALLAAGIENGTIRMWSTLGWEERPPLRGHEGAVNRLRFSPTGTLIVSAGRDLSVRVWDLEDGSCRAVLRPHKDLITDLDISAGGRYLASASRDGNINVWDLHLLPGADRRDASQGPVMALAFSPDGRSVATGSRDRIIRIWEARSGEVIRTLSGHEAVVFAVAFSPDGTMLASGSADCTLRLWDLEKRRAPLIEHADGPYHDLSFSRDGRSILACGDTSTTVLVRHEGTELRARPLGHSNSEESCVFSPDGTRVATGSRDRSIREWDVASGRLLRQSPSLGARISSVAYGGSGRWIAAAALDGSLVKWHLKENTLETILSENARSYWLHVDSGGGRIGVPHSNGVASIVDSEMGETQRLIGHRSEVNRFRFAPQGHIVATASDDCTVRMWNAESGRALWRWIAVLHSTGEVLTHRGWRSLSAGNQRSSLLPVAWRRRLETEVRFAEGAQDLLCAVTFGGDLEIWNMTEDRRVASSFEPDITQVLAVRDGCVARTAQGEVLLVGLRAEVRRLAADVRTVALSEEELLVTAGRSVRLLDLRGDINLVFEAAQEVSAATRVSRTFVLGHENGSLSVHAEGGRTTAPVGGFEDMPTAAVTCLEAGPMDTVIAGFEDGRVGIWNLQTGSRLSSASVHGPVTHLLIVGDRVHAVSELGDVATLDIGVLFQDYCALLRGVWHDIPVIWEGGRAVVQTPPESHPCNDGQG